MKPVVKDLHGTLRALAAMLLAMADDYPEAETPAVDQDEVDRLAYLQVAGPRAELAGASGGWATGKIAKVDSARRMVFGWANISMTADGVEIIDAHQDSIESSVLEAAAYDHVLNFRATGEMHQGETVGELVESFFVNAAKLEAMGLPEGSLPTGWWTGYRLTPEAFEKVLDGTYRAFSIQGQAERVPVEES